VAIELAVALGAIATKALVSDFIRGTHVTRDTWAQVATEVVDIMTANYSQQASSQRQLGQRIDQLSGQIQQIGGQIEAMPVGEFDHYMEAGRRYMLDLPVRWRTDTDRRELIRGARHEFVNAVASARLMKDAQREALAEVAIAGCWLWVPSLEDVKNTIGRAREILEHEVLFGQSTPTAAYADVLALAKSYGERSRRTAMPVVPKWGLANVGARLAVSAVTGQWVECAGVELKLGAIRRSSTIPRLQRDPFDQQTATLLPGWRRSFRPASPVASIETVEFTVRNKRADDIYASLGVRAILVHLTSRGFLRDVTGILPGATSSLRLTPVGPRPDEPDELDWRQSSVARRSPNVDQPHWRAQWGPPPPGISWQGSDGRWSPATERPAWPAKWAGPTIGFLLPDSRG